MERLPDGLEPYNRTPEFTHSSVPAGLLRDHATKHGVWGVIHVVRGELIYRIAEPCETHRLSPANPGVVVPEVLHSVELVGDAAFFVEFWRAKT